MESDNRKRPVGVYQQKRVSPAKRQGQQKSAGNRPAGHHRSRREQIMRRRRALIIAAAAVAVIAIVVIACLVTGVFEDRAEKSTLTIREDGTVICEEVTTFDADYYDTSELRDYAREQVDAYNEENENGRVTLQRVAVKDGKAYMRIAYASAEDYQKFTGYELFVGNIAQAQEAGYTFQDSFVSVADGEKSDSAAAEDIVADTGQKVLILRENITVKLDGDIRYLSDESTTLEGADTVSITQVDGNEDATSLTYVIYQ